MKTVKDMLKECDIKENLLALLAGVPKKRFAKMLEQYYSLYYAVLEAWYGDGCVDWILTDFRQSESKDGRKVYSFYGKNPEISVTTEATKIDWDQIVLGKVRVYVPDCIADKINDKVLCSMFLHQLYEKCTVSVQKNANKHLFDHIKSLPKERKSNISAYESLLEMIIHYFMDKDYINNAILEYKESKCTSFKWGDLLCECDWKFVIPRHFMNSEAVAKFLDQALQYGGIPKVYRYFRRFDDENPPNLRRLYTRLELLKSDYEDIELSDYLEVTNDGKRIIVENNVCYMKLPLIYIRDGKGNQSEIDEVELSELLCMDIYVLDEGITEPEQVLALLAFYLEYPIRIERIQRKFFVQSVIGMKTMLLVENAADNNLTTEHE